MSFDTSARFRRLTNNIGDIDMTFRSRLPARRPLVAA
jgi:hypothetical protein